MKFKKHLILKSFLVLVLVLFNSKTYASDTPYIDFYTSKNYLTHINKGYIAMDMSNYPIALKEFMTAHYIDSNIFATYDALGDLFFKTKNTKKALESYQKALDLLAPKHSNDLLKKIIYLRETKDIKTSLLLYKLLLSIRPEAGLQMLYAEKAKKEDNLDKALVYYKRAYDLQEDPDKYLKYIQVKYSNKEYERYLVRKYLKSNLKYSEAHYQAGLIEFKNNNYSNAMKEFKKAVEEITIPSIENKYIYHLALSYYMLSNKTNLSYLDQSIVFWQKYLKSYPNDIKALFNLAKASFYKDLSKMRFYDAELNEAEKDFFKVSNLSEKDPEYIDSKRTLDFLLEKKYSPALFSKSLDILNKIKSMNNSPDVGVYFSLGNVYFRKGFCYQKGFYENQKYMNNKKISARDTAWNYYKKAIEEYKLYLAKNPNNEGSVYYDIGITYYNASKLEPNSNDLPINADNKNNYNKLGVSFFKKDMINGALNNFDIYLTRNSNNRSEVLKLIKELKAEK